MECLHLCNLKFLLLIDGKAQSPWMTLVELKTIPQSITSAKRRQIKDIYKCVPNLDLNEVESCWENLCADRSICSKSDKRQ